MERIASVKKRLLAWGIVLGLSLVAIIAAFCVHCREVNVYNSTVRTVSSSDADENGVSVNIHPRGQSTDSWDKKDDELGTTIRGIIYEVTVTNGSQNEMNEWSLTLGFDGDYFINNAWCGTVELHQNINGKTYEQTLDLRNYDRDSVALDYHISGNDLMLTISPDTTVIYHPSSTDGEIPLDAGSSVNSGIIFYSYTDDVGISNFELEYKLHRDYIDNDAYVYIAAAIIWAICLIGFIVIAIMSMQYEKRLEASDRLIRESLDVFSNFVDAKDPYTKGHSSRVALYSRNIAEKLGFSDERCKQVYYTALLHDIGKCYVPDEILKKPSRLTDEEFDIIKTHTTHGAEMVQNFSSIPDIRDGALYHHERYDGKGYPTGCKGEDIPLIGRIICVADSFDAMNSSRVYREKLPREVIVKELEQNSGTQFDPKLVEVFLDILRDMPEEQ